MTLQQAMAILFDLKQELYNRGCLEQSEAVDMALDVIFEHAPSEKA